MGLMKEFLEEKITQYAKIIGVTEQEVYENDALYNLAVKFAQQNLNAKLEELQEQPTT
jgi:hypothetical protein